MTNFDGLNLLMASGCEPAAVAQPEPELRCSMKENPEKLTFSHGGELQTQPPPPPPPPPPPSDTRRPFTDASSDLPVTVADQVRCHCCCCCCWSEAGLEGKGVQRRSRRSSRRSRRTLTRLLPKDMGVSRR
ncbi:uncharacterized protein V6R79_025363 [Siganus canaliculatus]